MRSFSPLYILVGCALAFAGSAYGKNDFKLQGRIGLGVETPPEGSLADIFEMRLGVKTKRKEGFRAYLDLRADEDGRETAVQDAFVDWKNQEKTSRIRFGRGKKILGYEYDYPTSDRLSIHRSLTYQFLSSRNLVGRDYFVGYQWTSLRRSAVEEKEAEDEEDKTRASDLDSSVGNPQNMIDADERWRLDISAHYDESRDSAIVLSAITVPSPRWRLGAFGELQWTRGLYGTTVHSIEAIFSTLYQAGAHRAAVELFFGDDNHRTQNEEYYGSGRRIRAAAIKAEYALYFGPWNPYVVGTFMLKDLSHTGDHTEEEIVGLRYYLTEGLSLAGEYRYTRSAAAFDRTSEAYGRNAVAFIGRYFF